MAIIAVSLQCYMTISYQNNLSKEKVWSNYINICQIFDTDNYNKTSLFLKPYGHGVQEMFGPTPAIGEGDQTYTNIFVKYHTISVMDQLMRYI